MSEECIKLEEDKLNCNGTIFEAVETLSPENTWFWIYLSIYIALVLLAGLMSGLTMGLLSLDVMSLNVLSSGGKPDEKKYAAKILPLVKRHHLLLVTLLLANAAAVESMPLFLDKVSNPLTAIIVSVTAVLIFGEVVPQAFCTRYGLAIGAALSPLVYFLIFITFPISWPMAKLLDLVLGKEHGTFFRRAELKALVDLHQTQQDANNEEPLTEDEALIIKGALSMKDKNVSEICTPIQDLFSIDYNSFLDRKLMDEIISRGHSRVPVYWESKHNFIGLLLVKTLIKFDPETCTPISEVFLSHKRELLVVTGDTHLYECLNLFQLKKSHMFMVVENPQKLINTATEIDVDDIVVGVLTLEDVIEELIGEEIVDETDVYIDIQKKIKVAKGRAAKRSLSVAKPTDTHLDVHLNVENDNDKQPLLSSS